MKNSKKILSILAACVITTSLTGCSIKTGQNKFEACITSMSLNDNHTISSPKGADITNADSLSISYLDFKKEYLYWLKSYGVSDDSSEEDAAICAARRSAIIEYMVEERIVLDKASQLGADKLTEEEMEQLDAEYQENLAAQYEYFASSYDFGTLEDGATISDEEKLAKGEELFDAFLSDCLLTKDDLLMWQRNALITNKLFEEVTKDVAIDRSEAKDVLNNYIETVEQMYKDDPTTYETGGQYSTFWLPEGSRNIKHILIGLDSIDSDEVSSLRDKGDDAAADALLQEKLEPLKAEAEAVMEKLDNGGDFDALIQEYSDDAAAATYYPDGYTVIPNSVSFVKPFVDAAFSIEKQGEYVLAASDFGWHIVLYASDAKVSQKTLDDYENYIYESLVSTAKEETYTKLLKQWKQEYAFETDYEALKIDPPAETAESSADAS